MLLAVHAQKLLVFETGVRLFRLGFVSVLRVAKLAVLDYHLLVLPGSPDLVLDLLLLFRCLLDAEQYLLLSLLDFDEILVLILIHDHLSPAFVPFSSVDLLDFWIAFNP